MERSEIEIIFDHNFQDNGLSHQGWHFKFLPFYQFYFYNSMEYSPRQGPRRKKQEKSTHVFVFLSRNMFNINTS